MAHFAKLGVGNIVEQVIVVSNDVATTEQAGVDFINKLYNTRDVWKQTSYNTVGGIHSFGGTPFRKNYAGIGYTYDQSRDAFIPPKIYNSWILNEDTCIWEAPMPSPSSYRNEEDKLVQFRWNENILNWEEFIL